MLRALARLPFLAVRQLRWRKGAWSKDSDREYHEQLYDAQDYDAFRASYPGYVTIRRFADHAEILMPATGAVLDIGCGPGEITCELARRHPHLSFLGIDHSSKAIQRATRNAARLKLANIRFQAIGAEDLPATDRYGLVLMFDAFHHLEQPARVPDVAARAHVARRVDRARGHVDRPLGAESRCRLAAGRSRQHPRSAGSAVRRGRESRGGWRLADGATPAGQVRASAAPVQGEGAVERRYALDDFENFFRGWTLHITGTIAGFDRYPARRARGERAAAGDR